MARRTAQPVLLLTDGVDPAGLDVDLAQRTFFRLTADRDRESLTIGPVVVQRDHNFTADLRATFSLSLSLSLPTSMPELLGVEVSQPLVSLASPSPPPRPPL